MAEKAEAQLDDFTEESNNQTPGQKKGKRLILLLIPLITLVVGGIAYGVFYVFKKQSLHITEEEQIPKPVVTVPEYIYIDVNDLTVNIAQTNGKSNFLKLSFSYQCKGKIEAEAINTKLSIIKDSFQTFLRELRPSDLSGSAGVMMLRTELLKRVNKIIAPLKVNDVLFKEILMS